VSRNADTASVGREPLWDETAVGETRGHAPVGGRRLSPLSCDFICGTAVYVIRIVRVVWEGRGREASPYPK
jgi:hypothetical protein